MENTLLDQFMRSLGRSVSDLRTADDAYNVISIYSEEDLNDVAPSFGFVDGAQMKQALEDAVDDFANRQFADVEEMPQIISTPVEVNDIEQDEESESETEPKRIFKAKKLTDDEKREIANRVIGGGEGGEDEGGEDEGGEDEGGEDEGGEDEGGEGKGKGKGKGKDGGEDEGGEDEGGEDEGGEDEGGEDEGGEDEGGEDEGGEDEGGEDEGGEDEGGEDEEEEEEEDEILTFDMANPLYSIEN